MRQQLHTRPDVRVADLAAEQRGVLSIEELLASGLSHQAVARRVRTGRLHGLHRGVYANPTAREDDAERQARLERHGDAS
ncbi:MAG: Transcriptional regulator, AbiEi antitoxin [Solirubrobacteraceae bacterium]|jgi:predicted transcriptional regulator of viral defense system|nr:Transcriptional regulator, AbiEi antitoxin [Solirubrobacteraceae bacterium]